MSEAQEMDSSTISYSDADLAREASEEKLADGIWCKFVVDKATKKTNEETGDRRFTLRCSPLSADDGQTRLGPAAYVSLTMPITNADHEGHVPPSWAGSLYRQYLTATRVDEHPHNPKRINGKWMYGGDEIEKSEVDSIKVANVRAMMDFCIAAWKDPDLFKDDTFFGKVKHSGDFVNLNNLCAELPEGVELASDDQLKSDEVIDLEAVGKPAKSSKAPVKAASAKTNGKKNGKR